MRLRRWRPSTRTLLTRCCARDALLVTASTACAMASPASGKLLSQLQQAMLVPSRLAPACAALFAYSVLLYLQHTHAREHATHAREHAT